jgi:outer membrane lipoprotein LolB
VRAFPAIGLVVLVLGCAQPGLRPTLIDGRERAWVSHRAAVEQLHAWSVIGRISLFNESEAWNGTVRWRQDRERYAIRLTGPLGQGGIAVVGDDVQVVLKTSDGTTTTAGRPEVLLSRQLGLPVPVRGLRYWVRGLPEPGAAHDRELDAEGRLARLSQNGWQMEVLSYEPVDGVVLPRKIFLESAEWNLRLVVDQWTLSPTGTAQAP